VLPGTSKRLLWLSLGIHADAAPRFERHLDARGIARIAAPAGADTSGIWLAGPDGLPVQLRVAEKVSPSQPAPREIAPLAQPRAVAPLPQPQVQQADDGYIYPADGSSDVARYPAPRSSRRLYDAQANPQQQYYNNRGYAPQYGQQVYAPRPYQPRGLFTSQY
jgi:hypothetical protein